jgi:hypothetical protein
MFIANITSLCICVPIMVNKVNDASIHFSGDRIRRLDNPRTLFLVQDTFDRLKQIHSIL